MPARPVPPPDPVLHPLGLDKHKRDTKAHPIFSDQDLSILEDSVKAYIAILPPGNIYIPPTLEVLHKVQAARLAR